MEQVTSIQDKKSFLRNDRKLVCSMFVVYGLCILSLVAATVWGLDSRSKQIAANATATAFAATATTIARITEQAQYNFVDPFDNNREQWETDSINDEYMSGSVSIRDGVYIWEVQKVKQPFIRWEDFPAARWVGDFDVYVDSRVKTADGTASRACSGFVFRESPSDWETGVYVFSVCNFNFYVDYYGQGKWETISGSTRSHAIRNSDWNRLEISARGSQFTFIINHEVVYEMTDDRLPRGGLALFADINEEKPVTIWFDNFGFQPR